MKICYDTCWKTLIKKKHIKIWLVPFLFIVKFVVVFVFLAVKKKVFKLNIKNVMSESFAEKLEN